VSLDFNKSYLNEPVMQHIREFQPDIVVSMLGTNDAYLRAATPQLYSDYKRLIEVFQAFSSSPKIFIAMPPPVYNNSIGLNSTVLDDEVVPLITQTAYELHLPLIDAHTPLLSHPEDFLDGVHQNGQGTKIIATHIFNGISKAS
jgi:acyl-CoA thioesterase-1